MYKVLTIAGSDSGGGAGIQADLKTITVLGGYGLSVLTALTAQNTLGVAGIHPVPAHFVTAQLDAVLSDIGCHAAKTGMLFSDEIIEAVAAKVQEYKIENLVVDPVMVAASGDPLLKPEAERAMVAELFPLAKIITPNIPEAERILDREIASVEDMREAARALAETGPRAVLLKGGHLRESASDVLFYAGEIYILEAGRIATENTHGTGCVFSAALATFLAQGLGVADAAGEAKGFITRAIKSSISVGRGRGPADPFAAAVPAGERARLLEELKEAFSTLQESPLSHLMVPEVQMNLCYALPGASDPSEVAAFPGRIVRLKEGVAALSAPEFGASSHMARVVITAMSRYPELRAAMNVRYSPKAVDAAQSLGMVAASFSRAEEPPDIKMREGSTLSWGVAEALDSAGRRADLVFDTGERGKEAMIRLFGESPAEVVGKALALARELFG